MLSLNIMLFFFSESSLLLLSETVMQTQDEVKGLHSSREFS